MKNINYLKAFKRWIPGAVIITFVAGFVYVSVQQVVRQAANDPQIQIAEDITDSLNTGSPTNAYGSNFKVDIKKSLASFIMVLDDTGKVVESTGVLNDKVPVPPSGIYESARASGENRVTWEPETGTREAVIVKHYDDKKGSKGFVLVGRSLRESENRTKDLLTIALAFWIISLIAWYAFKLWHGFFHEEHIS